MGRFALGWLGWSQDQLDSADLNALVMAYDGRTEMIHTLLEVTGFLKPQQASGGAPLDARGRPIVMTSKVFDVMFGGKAKRRTH